MDSISFNSKILLFGEYGIMHDSDALSIPYKKIITTPKLGVVII